MKKYTYKIYHEYQIGDQSVTFRSAIDPEAMRDLLAALQFHYEEHVDESDSVCGKAATEVIHKLYAPVEYVESADDSIVINTYYNREARCGEAYQHMKMFEREGVVELIKEENEKETTRILAVLAGLTEEDLARFPVI